MSILYDIKADFSMKGLYLRFLRTFSIWDANPTELHIPILQVVAPLQQTIFKISLYYNGVIIEKNRLIKSLVISNPKLYF